MIWVAEIGSAHNGSKAQAFEMIRQAKLAGATIAKFQFGWTDDAQFKYTGAYRDVRYIDEWAEDLAQWCKHFDIELMASIWSMEGLEVARKVGMKRYKLAHQMDDVWLITEMAKDNKETFWSNPPKGQGNYRDLFCSENYPQYPDPLDNWMWDEIERHYGYSSHMHGYADALIAVARGAQYIEKHVTLNKADVALRDNAFALSFEEFGEMTRIGNEMACLR